MPKPATKSQITRTRYGLAPDGRPLEEVTTYVQVSIDHPSAEVLVGAEEGTYWTVAAVSSPLAAFGARVVSQSEYANSVTAAAVKVKADRDKAEKDAKDGELIYARELKLLGMSDALIARLLHVPVADVVPLPKPAGK